MIYIIENDPYSKEHMINKNIVSDFKNIIEKFSFLVYFIKIVKRNKMWGMILILWNSRNGRI